MAFLDQYVKLQLINVYVLEGFSPNSDSNAISIHCLIEYFDKVTRDYHGAVLHFSGRIQAEHLMLIRM
jgi:hypothetical protein